jgi:HPt (histidine-containing phosphotransfer) domain-containing protein
MQEILHLFVKQLESARETLALEPGPDEIRCLAHRLKGAALAVGAYGVAEIASGWENNGIPSGGFAAAIAAHEAATQEFREACAKITA